MLDEFNNICQRASDNTELSERYALLTNEIKINGCYRLKQNVFVFKCTFENATPPGTTARLSAPEQIGIRMQYQLWKV